VAAALAAAFAIWWHHSLPRPARGSAGRAADTPQTAAAIVRSAARRRTPRSGGCRVRWALAGAVFVVVAAASVVAAAPDGAVHVIVLDVGQGDAILLEGDRGSRILVDGGPDGTALLAEMDKYVPAWDRRLDAVILTHPHEDHVGGLTALVQRYHVGRAFESGWPSSTPGYLAWKAALASGGVADELLATGQRIGLDGASLDVIWPDDGRIRSAGLDPAATDNRKTNDASVVLLGNYEGHRFLLAGDAEDDVDAVLLSRGLPGVDMLKVAHHGSATASSEALLTAAHPALAVISVGAKNTYGHPNPGTVARLRAHSLSVHRTDQEGTVEITLDRSAVKVATTRAAAPVGRVSGPALVVATDPGAATPGVATPGDATPGDATPSVAAVAGVLGEPRNLNRLDLLYDSADVRTRPSRQRGTAALHGPAGVVPAPLASSGRNRRLAGLEDGFRRIDGRSPPRGVGGAPA
jgi:competence protein ComEC